MASGGAPYSAEEFEASDFGYHVPFRYAPKFLEVDAADQIIEYTPATDTLLVRCEKHWTYATSCVTHPGTGYIYCLGGYTTDEIIEFLP